MEREVEIREIPMTPLDQELLKVQQAMQGVRFVELGTSKRSVTLLEEYHPNVYCKGFEDAGECEGVEDMIKHLRQSAAGEIEEGSFHVFLALKKETDAQGREVEKVVAGRNITYLSKYNTIWSEFRTTEPGVRGIGIGYMLVKATVEAMDRVAQAHGHQHLDYSMIEQNDPARYLSSSGKETPEVNQSRVDKARRDGWHLLHVNYVQPALASTGLPVKGLNLLGRSEDPRSRQNREEAPLQPIAKEKLAAGHGRRLLSKRHGLSQPDEVP